MLNNNKKLLVGGEEPMKLIKLFLFLCVALILNNCVTTKKNNSFQQNVSKNYTNEGRYQVLGSVSISKTENNPVNTIKIDKQSYDELMEQAEKMGANAIINLEAEIRYRAVAVRMQDNVSNIYTFENKSNDNNTVNVKTNVPQIQNINNNNNVLQDFNRRSVEPEIDNQNIIANKKYFVIIEGQKYGPVNIEQIKNLKNMGYCDNQTNIIEIESGKILKVDDILY
jgi:hypothetical protein